MIKMKKISALFAVVMAVALTSCNQVSKEQYQQATSTNDSLMYVALQQGNEIYELSTTLNAVSDELNQINGQICESVVSEIKYRLSSAEISKVDENKAKEYCRRA